MTRKQAAAAGAAALAAVALLLAWLAGEGGGEIGTSRSREDAGETRLPEALEENAVPMSPAVEAERTEPEPEPEPLLPPAPEVPEETFLLEGLVLDSLDAPVAGAVVSWGTLPPPEEEGKAQRRDPFLLPRPAPFCPVASAVSGEDGAFRLAGPPRSRVLITAFVPGGRVEPFGPFLFEGNRRGVVLRVAPATAVTGVVLRPPEWGSWPKDEEPPPPTPEPGARVVAWWRGSPYESHWPPRFEDAVADAEGRFRIEGVPPGECTVEALAADGLRAELRRREGATADLRLLLKEPWRWGTPFRGMVLLSDGATPAGRARLEVFSAAMKEGEPPILIVCAGDGSFEHARVPSRGPGVECPLDVTVDAGTRGVARLSVPAWPLSGDERIVLWPPEFRTVRGVAVAVDGEGTPPVPGLPLRIASWHESPTDPRIRIPVEATVRTRIDGTFAAEGQGANLLSITVPPGAAPFEVARVVAEGDTRRVEVVPACTLEGTVRTAEGEFVEGALCSWSGREFVLSDGQGRFRFHPVPGDRALVVTARVPGWTDARSLPVTVPRGGAVRDLMVILDARAVALSGRVVDGEGAPLALARVEVTHAGKSPRGWDSLPGAWTDGGGWWRLDMPPGGPWRVTATARGRLPDFVDDVAAGAAIRDLRLVSGESGK